MKADRVKMTEHIKRGLYYILGFLSENESRKNSRVTFFLSVEGIKRATWNPILGKNFFQNKNYIKNHISKFVILY